MSLVIGARFRDGILLASDPFVFNNDGEFPLKSLNFHRFHIVEKMHLVMTSIGSNWVFREFTKWLETSQITNNNMMQLLPLKWAELSASWRDRRTKETSELRSGTLRPISHSVCLMGWGKDLQSVFVFDEHGNFEKTSTFLISGSGSLLVEHFLNVSGNTFRPNDSLDQCFDLVEECFSIASQDLYVMGQPVIALLTPSRVLDFTEQCTHVYLKHSKGYFNDMKAVLKA